MAHVVIGEWSITWTQGISNSYMAMLKSPKIGTNFVYTKEKTEEALISENFSIIPKKVFVALKEMFDAFEQGETTASTFEQAKATVNSSEFDISKPSSLELAPEVDAPVKEYYFNY
ncbi:MAG: hypothetical protein CMH26_07950 [Micavibrio sp.]|nr:hypothetical protein [Micavibrio sp.]|tara:strand:+ start:1687 stop:2034 length:348 start_codon:yes stop_codon:yes gene_type:complete